MPHPVKFEPIEEVDPIVEDRSGPREAPFDILKEEPPAPDSAFCSPEPGVKIEPDAPVPVVTGNVETPRENPPLEETSPPAEAADDEDGGVAHDDAELGEDLLPPLDSTQYDPLLRRISSFNYQLVYLDEQLANEELSLEERRHLVYEYNRVEFERGRVVRSYKKRVRRARLSRAVEDLRHCLTHYLPPNLSQAAVLEHVAYLPCSQPSLVYVNWF